MATIVIEDRPQGRAEVRQRDFDFGPDLETGATILSVTAAHRPPSGTPSTAYVGTIVGSVVPVKLGPINNDVPLGGQHILDCFATMNTPDSEVSQIRVLFMVLF
jgi:hypothetical protein